MPDNSPPARARALEGFEWERTIPLTEAETLISLGVIEAVAGDHERASVLLAVGRALGEGRVRGFRSPMSYALYKHYLPIVRGNLGSDTARRTHDQGHAMTLEGAIRYAHRE